MVENHAVDGADGVDHRGAVACGFGESEMVGDVQCPDFGNGLIAVAGKDVGEVRAVIVPGALFDFLTVGALSGFRNLTEGGDVLLLGELRGLELLVEGFEVPITEVVAACGIGVACLVAAVLALGEHGCVIDAFCHLKNLLWYGNLKGQRSPSSIGFFCIALPVFAAPGGLFSLHEELSIITVPAESSPESSFFSFSNSHCKKLTRGIDFTGIILLVKWEMIDFCDFSELRAVNIALYTWIVT